MVPFHSARQFLVTSPRAASAPSPHLSPNESFDRELASRPQRKPTPKASCSLDRGQRASPKSRKSEGVSSISRRSRRGSAPGHVGTTQSRYLARGLVTRHGRQTSQAAFPAVRSAIQSVGTNSAHPSKPSCPFKAKSHLAAPASTHPRSPACLPLRHLLR